VVQSKYFKISKIRRGNRAIHHFHYQDGALYCEQVALSDIAAEVGTPCYVYSHETLTRHYRVFAEPLAAVQHLICYSMKANSSAAILNLLLKMGSGLDIVSGGELYRALQVGADPAKIVFSGVGKTVPEIHQALDAQILMFNVESAAELERIQAVATERDQVARVSIRVNPDIDPRTHPYIATGLYESKFGVDIDSAQPLFSKAHAFSHIELVGVDCHIGSQITELQPFLDALERIQRVVRALRAQGLPVRYLDLGGGLGIPYQDEAPPHPSEYARAIVERTTEMDCTLVFEPGRVIVGNAGILLTRVQYIKENLKKRFVIVDTGMHHLIRPTLYQAWQGIQMVVPRTGVEQTVDVVGPICESGDFLAQGRVMPPIEADDLLAVMSAGAYGFSMASQYNSYPRPAEVMVKGSHYAVIRERESYADLVRGERVPDLG